MRKLYALCLSLLIVCVSILPVNAASNPVVTSSYNNRYVYSATKQFVYGKVSVAKNQRVILYNSKGKPVSVQRLPNTGGSASYKLPCPTLSKGKNVFIVRSEKTGSIDASNALAVVYYLVERQTVSTSSTGVVSGGTSKSIQDVKNGACAWAKAIAADNSFHYGKGKAAHHNGCYFCQTQPKAKKGAGPDWQKTYCCNPFVTAAFAHGGGSPEALKLCQKCKSWWVTDFPNSSSWKSLGKPSVSSLQPGDVLTSPHHVMLYVGDGKIAHASGGDNGKKGSDSWNNSIRVSKCSSKSFSKAYRYIGGYGGKIEIPN